MNARKEFSRWCVGGAIFAALGACGVSKVTEDAVARAETSFQQAKQAIGNSESGAVDLQRAGSHLQQAKGALESGDDEPAQRHAQQAELDVELAGANAQNSSARKAAAELQASIETLRHESQRSTGATH
jgi:chromosome segregation ATPase